MHLVRFFFRAGDYHFFEVKKTMHLIKQLDETDCGAACIAMIARFYKSSYPVTRIREIAGTIPARNQSCRYGTSQRERKMV